MLVLFAGLIDFSSFALGSCTGERIRDRWDQFEIKEYFLLDSKKYFLLDSKSISCLIQKVFLAWSNHSSRTSACSIHYYCYWICDQHNTTDQCTFSQGCTCVHCTRVYNYESLGVNLSFDAQIEKEYIWCMNIWTFSVWIESWHRFWMQGMDWCYQDGQVSLSTFHSISMSNIDATNIDAKNIDATNFDATYISVSNSYISNINTKYQHLNS